MFDWEDGARKDATKPHAAAQGLVTREIGQSKARERVNRVPGFNFDFNCSAIEHTGRINTRDF